jgi:uncharacterized protein (DUF58 family)
MVFSLRRWFTTLTTPPAVVAAGTGVQLSVDELLRLRWPARQLELMGGRRSVAARPGPRPTRARGRGLEYQESRDYQPGDDIRQLDWRLTARTGRPHTKLYQEERERPVIVLVDLSPSMFFATQGAFKSVIAGQVAALLGWAAVQQGDRIGAFLSAPAGHQELRPAGGRRGILRLLQALVAWTQPGTADCGDGLGLGASLHRVQRVTRPGSLIFLLSDFYGLDEEADSQLNRLSRQAEVVACQILDPLELQPPPPGRYPISDGQQGAVWDTRTPAARAHDRTLLAARQGRIQRLARRRGLPLLRLYTADDVATALARGLREPWATAEPLP